MYQELMDVELRSLIASGQVTVSHCRLFTHQLLTALRFAHGAGIIHCGLKPSNVLVSCQQLVLKLADFQFARLASSTPEPGKLMAVTSLWCHTTLSLCLARVVGDIKFAVCLSVYLGYITDKTAQHAQLKFCTVTEVHCGYCVSHLCGCCCGSWNYGFLCCIVEGARVPTQLESQGINLIRKVGKFCWWSWNFGSLRTKTAIFVYVSGQSSYSLM